MNFDQMLETWRTQDVAPLYGVNHDALRQALQAEDANVQRVRRRAMWIVCIFGVGMAALGIFWVAILIINRWPAIYAIASGVGCLIIALWVGAYCGSRWRQTKYERNFGNTLKDEVRRTLSRIDVEISRFGHWSTASLQIAPGVVGPMLIAWSVRRSQSDGPDSLQPWQMFLWVLFMVYMVRRARRYTQRTLEPRQRRLRELLAALDDRE